METDSRRVGERVGERRRDRIDRRLAHGLRTERPERVVSFCEIDFVALRNVGKSRDAIIAKSRIHHASALVVNHLFEKRPAKSLRDRAVDLRAALHWIDDHTAVGAVNALQNNNLAGDAIDCDAKALDLEGDAARGAISLADN